MLLRVLVTLLGLALGQAASAASWDDTLAEARGQTVYWDAWGGDPQVNAYIDWVGEQVFYSPTRLAPTYEASERSDRLPRYFISRTMPLLADPAAWRFVVDGLVERPLALSLDELAAMPRVSYTVKHHCVEGWSAVASWHGVPVAAVVDRCRPRREARFITFTSFDAGYANGWDLASAMHPQTILAYGMNDNPLPAAHGAPLRLYAPTKLGYKMTKYLLGMTFTDRRPGGYWEDRGYPWFGGV